jgi:hypothetical protein
MGLKITFYRELGKLNHGKNPKDPDDAEYSPHRRNLPQSGRYRHGAQARLQ